MEIQERFSNDFLFRYFRALIIIPIAFEILFLIYEMCLVKDNFSSMITPKIFVRLTRFKEMLLRLISILVCLVMPCEISHNVIYQCLESVYWMQAKLIVYSIPHL